MVGQLLLRLEIGISIHGVSPVEIEKFRRVWRSYSTDPVNVCPGRPGLLDKCIITVTVALALRFQPSKK